jgi:hypothetical protein
MDFQLVGPIEDIQTIAGRWRKMKGIVQVRLIDGTIHTAEVHCYEAHGIGRKELKIKFPLLD